MRCTRSLCILHCTRPDQPAQFEQLLSNVLCLICCATSMCFTKLPSSKLRSNRPITTTTPARKCSPAAGLTAAVCSLSKQPLTCCQLALDICCVALAAAVLAAPTPSWQTLSFSNRLDHATLSTVSRCCCYGFWTLPAGQPLLPTQPPPLLLAMLRSAPSGPVHRA